MSVTFFLHLDFSLFLVDQAGLELRRIQAGSDSETTCLCFPIARIKIVGHHVGLVFPIFLFCFILFLYYYFICVCACV